MKNSQPKVVLVSKLKLDNSCSMQVQILDKALCFDIDLEMYEYIIKNSNVRLVNEDDLFIFNHFF